MNYLENIDYTVNNLKEALRKAEGERSKLRDNHTDAHVKAEARNNLLNYVLFMVGKGMRNKKAKQRRFFCSSNLADNILPGSIQEKWINILSSEKSEDIVHKCASALEIIKGFPFTDYECRTYKLLAFTKEGEYNYYIASASEG